MAARSVEFSMEACAFSALQKPAASCKASAKEEADASSREPLEAVHRAQRAASCGVLHFCCLDGAPSLMAIDMERFFQGTRYPCVFP
jgi:hypothetical protein